MDADRAEEVAMAVDQRARSLARLEQCLRKCAEVTRDYIADPLIREADLTHRERASWLSQRDVYLAEAQRARAQGAANEAKADRLEVEQRGMASAD